MNIENPKKNLSASKIISEVEIQLVNFRVNYSIVLFALVTSQNVNQCED